MLAEIHDGIYSNHFEENVLAGKVMQEGYYRLHTLKDAKEYMRKCQKCQEYSRVPPQPTERIHINHLALALRPVGGRLGKTPHFRQRGSKVHGSCSRLIHEVGGSRCIGNDHGKQHLKSSVEERRL